MRKKFKYLFMIMFAFLIVGCESKKENAVKIIEEESRNSRMDISVTGDIMYHHWTFTGAKKDNGKQSFTHFYEKINEATTTPNLMIGNYETTCSSKREMSDYPMFNTPEESIIDLKSAGFDVLTTANNHCLDSGAAGIEDTIDALDRNEIKHTGTWKKDERDYLIEEVNGIKIGILAYTQRFNGLESLLREDEKI